ncbi:MAG: hypothetical protein ABJO01_00930 [Parasphingorhabdus sp.]|uniref:hypothetical protein n=1 Tax=Parasphingorhabdus sp. TaxID=2709688 RepID=UPI0032986816
MGVFKAGRRLVDGALVFLAVDFTGALAVRFAGAFAFDEAFWGDFATLASFYGYVFAIITRYGQIPKPYRPQITEIFEECG